MSPNMVVDPVITLLISLNIDDFILNAEINDVKKAHSEFEKEKHHLKTDIKKQKFDIHLLILRNTLP